MIELDNAEQRDRAAGEYVLGTLDAEERSAFEVALGRDAALRGLVGAWQDRLLPLTQRTLPAQPSPSLWRRIESSLGLAEAPRPRPLAPPWWARVRLWQGLSAAGLAASLLMGALLLRQTGPEPAGARYLAVLQSPDLHATGWVVEVQAGGTLRLVPVGEVGRVPAGRAWQFWTKPEGAAGPTSLGLVPAGQTLVLPAARLPAVGSRQLFEITLEPEAGSPVGRPTGPILFVGRTVPL